MPRCHFQIIVYRTWQIKNVLHIHNVSRAATCTALTKYSCYWLHPVHATHSTRTHQMWTISHRVTSITLLLYYFTTPFVIKSLPNYHMKFWSHFISIIGASLSEPHINGYELREWDIYKIVYMVRRSLVTPHPTTIILYICCSNSTTCKFTFVYARLSLWMLNKPAKSSELRLQRVGGKSETEFVVNRSLSSTAAKSKRQNLTSHRVSRRERGQTMSMHPAAQSL